MAENERKLLSKNKGINEGDYSSEKMENVLSSGITKGYVKLENQIPIRNLFAFGFLLDGQ